MFWNLTKTEVDSGQQPSPPPSYYCPFHDAIIMTMMTMTTAKRAKMSEDTVLQNTEEPKFLETYRKL
jgi:hypothetical protein